MSSGFPGFVSRLGHSASRPYGLALNKLFSSLPSDKRVAYTDATWERRLSVGFFVVVVHLPFYYPTVPI